MPFSRFHLFHVRDAAILVRMPTPRVITPKMPRPRARPAEVARPNARHCCLRHERCAREREDAAVRA